MNNYFICKVMSITIKSSQKRLQGVSESLRLVFYSIRVCADCGMFHNAKLDLCGTVYRCANRL